MAINQSDFGIRIPIEAGLADAQETKTALNSAAESIANGGKEAHESALSHGELGAAFRELQEGGGLGPFGGLAPGMFSPEAMGMFAGIVAIQQLGKVVQEMTQRIVESAAKGKRMNDGQRETAADPSSLAGLRANSQAPAEGVQRLKDALEDREKTVTEGRTADDAAPGGADETEMPFAGTGSGMLAGGNSAQDFPPIKQADLAIAPAGYEGGGSNAAGATGDVEGRITEARRRVARASGDQDELRALLEQAVGVMEALMDQSPAMGVEDLKRRVAVLEQRVKYDRSNARS
jgi:hypothetical protein